MDAPGLGPTVGNWLQRRTFREPAAHADELRGAKDLKGITVSVCLPALNEEPTVGRICETVRGLIDRAGLVDELVVVDSGSSDGTMAAARAAGATAVAASDVLEELNGAAFGGKGETLWKSLAVATGDIVIWLDSDTRNFGTHFVTDLLGPLLLDDALVMTKAFYDRPLEADGALTTGGARVTELMVRPFLNLFYPELVGFIQPLSGEYAARREALLDIPLFTGYAVDVGILIDIIAHHGLGSVAQVDLGARVHRNQELLALGAMSHQIAQALLARLEESGMVKLLADPGTDLVQFTRGDDGPSVAARANAIAQRPPMRDVLEGNVAASAEHDGQM